MQIINPGEIRWLENETEQVYSSITEDGNLIIQITNFMGFTIWKYELTLTYATDKWQIEDINLIYSDWDFYDRFYTQ